MSFLGVYKTLYSYVPQNDEELAVEENDILYLLAKSDVDDWWTVKKRIVGADVDEPSGLVPSNYIEPADTIGIATALYDYDKQTDEELSFKEGEEFQVFDDKDPDWILVTRNNQEFGFVPSNYIEFRKANSSQQNTQASAILPPPSHPSVSASNVQAEGATFQPPPQRTDRTEAALDRSKQHEDPTPPLPTIPRPTEQNSYSRRESSYSESNYRSEEEDAPPPKPSRPNQGSSSSSRRRSDVGYSEDSREDPDELYTWQVSEVDGRKKKKAMLAIGNGTIYFSPDSINNGTPQQWKVKDLISYSSEKKHVFLELKNPFYSLEVHAGTKDVAAEILSILAELKGASNSVGLKEVKDASNSKGSKKTGKILYDFEAQGADELTVVEGEIVNIINDQKSKDWWMVQNTKSGRTGVVPSQFVEITQEKSGSFVSKLLSRSKSKENVRSSPQKSSGSPSKKAGGPKPSHIRTWEDRSGTFKVDAEFLGVVEGKIHLHKTNGVKIAVAAPKLSLVDLEYVERVTGMSLESYKTSSKSKSSSSGEGDRERRERKERERKRRERDSRENDRREKERERDRNERERDRWERQREVEERERLRRELDETKRIAEEARRAATEQPPAKPTRPQSASSTHNVSKQASKPDYDWFEFFLEAGVDVNQCQRYTSNFQSEQIDPSIIESIDASILRTLGLREGDIIRVTRFLDQKFNRQPKESSNGNLFSEPSGALKVNRTGSANQVGGSLPSPTKTPKSDDDAWTLKPAANSESSTQAPSTYQTQQFTGSMQDLVNLKPLQPSATASSVKSSNSTYAPTISSKPLEPSKTGASLYSQKTGNSLYSQKTGQITAQPTGLPLDPFKTGGGNLLPITTGGAFVYLPIQQTGVLQQTGLLPLQRTGLVPLQQTGGYLAGGALPLQPTGLVPLQKTGGIQAPLPLQQTGLRSGVQAPLALQRTGTIPLNPGLTGGLPQLGSIGSLPPTTFGQPPQASFSSSLTGQQTGLQPTFNQLPATTFGQPSLANSLTGNNLQQQTFTGQLPQTSFGQSNLPTAQSGFNQSFGALPLNTQPTYNGFPQTSFVSATPTGFTSQTTFNNQVTGFNPQSSFGNQLNSFNNQPAYNNQLAGFTPQPSSFTGGFSQQPSNQQINQLTSSFQNIGIQNQSPFNNGFQPSQQQTGFNGFQQPQQQATFNGFQQQQQQQQQQPQSTFGTFGQQSAQPLEAQPTGFGFGNSSVSQPQNGNLKANLANATPDNPFGF